MPHDFDPTTGEYAPPNSSVTAGQLEPHDDKANAVPSFDARSGRYLTPEPAAMQASSSRKPAAKKPAAKKPTTTRRNR